MKAPQVTLPARLKSGLATLFGILLAGSALANVEVVIRFQPELPTPPTVTLTDPVDGATWGVVPSFSVAASARDADGSISRVEFYLNSILVGSSQFAEAGTLSSFQAYLHSRPQAGTYTLTARAYDNSGKATTSAARTLKVPALPPLPVVTAEMATLQSATIVLVGGTLKTNGYFVHPQNLFFEYGLSTSYGGTARAGFSSESVPPVQGYLGGLERSTTYHFRLVAKTDFGISYSGDATFTTSENTLPTARDAFANVPAADPVAVYCDVDDADGEPLTFSLVTGPSHGTVEVGSTVPGGDFTYTPNASFAGEDEFTYMVSDEHGGTATAKVRLGNFRKSGVGRYATTIMTEYGQGARRAIGALGLDVTATGRFTGVVRFFDQRYPILGQFSVDGFCQLEIDRVGQPPITVNLGENGGPDGIAIGGNMHASSRDYEIISDTALIFSTEAPEAGAYTFALPPNRDDLPQGNGFVTGRVSATGAVVFAGRIGDGQAFSFGSQLRRGGSAQFYVIAGTEPRDRLSGRLQFPSDAATEASGNFVWFKAPRTEGFFQSGFTSELTIVGSRLDVSDADEPILDYTGETLGLDISFTDGESNALLDGLLAGLGEAALEFQDSEPVPGLRADNATTERVAKMARQQMFLSPTVRTVDFKVSRARGLFSGTFRNPAEGGRLRSFGGVFLQHQNSGTGLFTVGGRSGTVTITPR